ncbi:MAG: hypothetical protein R3F49_00095 [Planctomycetota bacterium]
MALLPVALFALGALLGGPTSAPSPSLGLAATVGGIGAPPHPNSLSASRIDVRGARVVVAIEVQVLSLAEVIEGFDEDRDGRVEAADITQHADEIGAYLSAHYRVAAAPVPPGEAGPAPSSFAGERSGWPALALAEPVSVREASMREGVFGDLEQYVRADLVFAASEAPEALAVTVELFAETSPEHRDLAVVVWNGVEVDAFDLAARDHRLVTASAEALARGRPAFTRYFEGVARRPETWWGLAALAVLLALGARDRKGAAFASLTLGALAVCGIALASVLVSGHPPNPRFVRFVGLAVPLSVAYVGLDSLLARQARPRLLEAAVFGLIAGAALYERFRGELVREAATEFQPASLVRPALQGLGAAALGITLLAALVTFAALRDRATPRRALAAAALIAGLVEFVRVAGF